MRQSGKLGSFIGHLFPSCRHQWSEPFKLDGNTVDYCMRCGARRTRLTLEPYRRRQEELLAAGAFGPDVHEAVCRPVWTDASLVAMDWTAGLPEA